LKVPYHEIKARIKDESNRGLVMGKEQDLLALYNERAPLYEAYAHAIIDCSGKDVEEIVRNIAAVLATG
jgi:shikimate kinase